MRGETKLFRKVLHYATTKATAFELAVKAGSMKHNKLRSKTYRTCVSALAQLSPFCFGLPEKRLQLKSSDLEKRVRR